MTAKIDRNLNLTVPVDTDDGTLWVFSTPIRREVFERYFLVISKTFAAIWSEGLSVVAGPRVAALMLRAKAEQLGIWEDVQSGLLAEIWRLTNILMKTDAGWQTVMFETARSQQLLSADDLAEVEGAIVFFILASAMHKKKEIEAVIESARLWGLQPTFSTLTEFRNSLTTSTPAGDSTPKAQPLSIPV